MQTNQNVLKKPIPPVRMNLKDFQSKPQWQRVDKRALYETN